MELLHVCGSISLYLIRASAAAAAASLGVCVCVSLALRWIDLQIVWCLWLESDSVPWPLQVPRGVGSHAVMWLSEFYFFFVFLAVAALTLPDLNSSPSCWGAMAPAHPSIVCGTGCVWPFRKGDVGQMAARWWMNAEGRGLNKRDLAFKGLILCKIHFTNVFEQ